MSDKSKSPTILPGPNASSPPADKKKRTTPLTEIEVMRRVDRLLAELSAKAASRVLAWLCLKNAEEQDSEFLMTLQRLGPPAAGEVKS